MIIISACIIMNINKRNELNDLSSLCMNNQSLSFVEDRSFKEFLGKKTIQKFTRKYSWDGRRRVNCDSKTIQWIIIKPHNIMRLWICLTLLDRLHKLSRRFNEFTMKLTLYDIELVSRKYLSLNYFFAFLYKNILFRIFTQKQTFLQRNFWKYTDINLMRRKCTTPNCFWIAII